MTPEQRDRLEAVRAELGEVIEALDVDEHTRELSLLTSADLVIGVVARTEWVAE